MEHSMTRYTRYRIYSMTIYGIFHDEIYGTFHNYIYGTFHDSIYRTFHDSIYRTFHGSICRTFHDSMYRTFHNLILRRISNIPWLVISNIPWLDTSKRLVWCAQPCNYTVLFVFLVFFGHWWRRTDVVAKKKHKRCRRTCCKTPRAKRAWRRACAHREEHRRPSACSVRPQWKGARETLFSDSSCGKTGGFWLIGVRVLPCRFCATLSLLWVKVEQLFFRLKQLFYLFFY